MSSIRRFDVLVVYTASVALSAGYAYQKDSRPFMPDSGRENYNDAYGYFLSSCKRLGLRAAFCTSADIIGSGTCSSYWLFTHGKWEPVVEPCYAQQIFDKFSPLTAKKKRERKLLFSSDLVTPFNDPALAALFFDKQLTYQRLGDFAIPTTSITNNSETGIKKSLETLALLVSNHPENKDFSHSIVLKDRFGAGGNLIYKISKNYVQSIHSLMLSHPTKSFVIQPFMNFARGYSYKKRRTNTDIRLIYHNGKIIQTYIRLAKHDDFRCNEHQGGELIYTVLADIPKNVLRLSERVAEALDQNKGLFALDYIVSDNNNVYFLEGNIGPGVDWNPTKMKNERMSKQLIRSIVREFARRADRLLLTPITSASQLGQVGYTMGAL